MNRRWHLGLLFVLIAGIDVIAQRPAQKTVQSSPGAGIVSRIKTTVREKETPARHARLGQLTDQLDRLPDSELDQKIEGHFALQVVDAIVIRHARWLITGAKSWDAARRARYGPRLVDSYNELAQALAEDGANDEALALVRGIGTDLPEVATAVRNVRGVRARLELIGTVGKPLTAPRWLSLPAGATTLDPKGKVTLIEFSAHWCGPCTQSYPALNRFRTAYAARGFQAVIATELYGYFGAAKSLQPDAELARDRAYFARHLPGVPVAIGDEVTVTFDGEETTYSPARDPNHLNYRVGGLPQFYLLDWLGRVRFLLFGYDNTTEARLSKLIRRLIDER